MSTIKPIYDKELNQLDLPQQNFSSRRFYRSGYLVPDLQGTRGVHQYLGEGGGDDNNSSLFKSCAMSPYGSCFSKKKSISSYFWKHPFI